MDLTIAQIVTAAQARYLVQPRSDEARVTSATWDSRDVCEGGLYVALPGERVDGHDFVEQAIAAGASVALVSRDPGQAACDAAQAAGAAICLVEDGQRALAAVGEAARDQLRGMVVGLTGSSGKTTTKRLIRDVLSVKMCVAATKANQNNELGVPATLLSATDERVVVVEMGMRGLGQIRELCDIAHPEWGLVTNVGESHIELLGSRENIARAKAEIYAALPENGLAFVNAADEYAEQLVEFGNLRKRGIPIVYFDGARNARPALLDAPGGAEVPCVWASDIVLDDEGRPSFTLNASNVPVMNADRGTVGGPLWTTTGSQHCTMQLRGLHNVINACAAAAVGLACGMRLEECAEGLAQAQPERGRQQVSHTQSGVTVVDDAYNANPDSMRASLATFAALKVSGRHVAVLGDMLELGDFSRECHERVGGLAARAGLDRLLCVGDRAQFIAEAAIAQGMDAEAVSLHAAPEEALAALRSELAEGDAVLVKASHSIGLERVVEGLVM